jgi:MacB-like periplasmic core domain
MLFDQLRQDLHYAARQMVKAPTLTVVMISMLALGIGANSALFSVLDRVASRPAPGIGASDDLVKVLRHIYQEGEGRFSAVGLSYSEFLDFRAQRAAFADLAIERRMTLGVRAQDLTSPVRAFLVSSSYFSLLRVQMTLGTGLPRDDDAHPAAQPLAVVSHRFWQQRLAGAPDAIGQRIDVNGVPFTVVGVAPPLFQGVELDENPVDLWVPIGALPLLYREASAALTDRDATHYSPSHLCSQV